jgi:hypothetical protein
MKIKICFLQLNKALSIISFLFSIFFYSQQKISIIDSETKRPIPQVRIEFNQDIFYTNDDGIVILPSEAKVVNIFAPEYNPQNNTLLKDKIELSLKFKNIDEVLIRPVDAKKIIESVLKDYDKNYETKTSIYRGTYKSRSKIDNQLNRLLIIDMDVWSLRNKYDYKSKRTDDFLQINLRNKKYDKNKKGDKNYIFNSKSYASNDNITSFLERIFLYNQLYVMDFTTKNFKIIGNIINETGDIQTISFKTQNINYKGLLFFEGVFEYNKKENTIDYLKVNQHQENEIEKFTNYFDQEISANTDVFTVAYEMYKKNGKYIPSKVTMNFNINLELEKKIHPATISDEFVFSSQNFANKKGLPQKIDLSKGLNGNIIDNTIKDNAALLSTEEQAFVDEP